MRPQRILPFLVLGLMLAAPVHAQTTIPGATSEPAPSAHEDAPDEGIHVSGEWTLTVYEPDGTFVKQHNFHNELVPNGALSIAQVLAQEETIGDWAVELRGVPMPCLTANDEPAACWLLDPGHLTEEGESVFKNLTASASANGELILDGIITAGQDGEIDVVRTLSVTCDSDIAPDDCVTDRISITEYMTQKTIDPVSVQSGQVVTVEVVIGFN